MKKLGKILLILLAVVLALFLFVLALGSKPYWTDVRSSAKPWETPDELTSTAQGTRFERQFADHTACVVFDENRQMVEAEGITPIDFDRKNFWGLWSYDAFVEVYGEPHFYIGNAWEAWVTDDGYVIVIWMANEWFYPFPLQATRLGGEIEVYDLLATPE